MLLWSDKFRPLIYLSVSVTLLGVAGFAFLPDGQLRLIAGIFAMAGLGGAVTSARCGFAFAANNSERLIGMTVMFFSVAGIYYLSSTDYGVTFVTIILPVILAVLLTVCLLLFREKDFDVKKESDKTDAKGLYWALAFFIAYFAIDGYIWRLVDNTDTLNFAFMVAGMLIAGMVFFILLLLCKMNVWHIWNIFFLFAVVMAVLAVFERQMGTAVPHYLFSGLSLIRKELCSQRSLYR